MTTYGFSSEGEFEDTLRDGITAAKNGSRRLAIRLLERANRMNPMDARPWLWLTETTDDPAEKRNYLEEALAVDPYNILARRGLALLDGKLDPDELLPVGEGIAPRPEQGAVRAQTETTFACPQCGGQIEFDLQTNNARCTFCGFERRPHSDTTAEELEQVLEFVLPTERGHHWAEGQHHLHCDNCGADSLWPVGQRATRCPYCGSNQMIESQETANLVDPHAIGMMKIDERAAFEHIKTWLGKGWFTPDDLTASAKKIALRPAYYPFWTFDGTLEIQWRCEVAEGHGEDANWVQRSGAEYELFDDVLISGNQTLSQKYVDDVAPFFLKEMAEFQPDYLAGWPALTYDRSLAKAALLAREKIVRAVRRELHQRVMPHRQKRSLTTGAVKWSGMTFKHILLPLWVGVYRYRGREYPVIVNGQTGKISGEKPRDQIKAIAIILSAILTGIALFALLFILALEMGWVGN